MEATLSPSAVAMPAVPLTTLDKALSVLVNTTLVLSITLATLMLLAAPGQPLDFLMSGSCGAGI